MSLSQASLPGTPRVLRRRSGPAALVLLSGLLLAPMAQAQHCEARSGARPPAVVELYTSEGCSSCPPADRWLSSVPPTGDVVALAFHVNYWDHLGWQDRFATPGTTARQHHIQQALGSAYVYTPQVLLNGADHRQWHGEDARSLTGLPPNSAPALRLSRDGTQITARIESAAGHTRLAGYWAVLQDGLSSRVTRGENAGEQLHHDHVVSLYQTVPPWDGDTPYTSRITLPPAAAHLRVAFVVTEPSGTRPLQALVLSCS